MVSRDGIVGEHGYSRNVYCVEWFIKMVYWVDTVNRDGIMRGMSGYGVIDAIDSITFNYSNTIIFPQPRLQALAAVQIITALESIGSSPYHRL